MRDAVRFIVKDEHLLLLRAAYCRWDYTEFGAPCIDPKRPYGNSDVLGDIREILAGTEQTDEELSTLHHETETVLEIALRVGEFEPGEYVADPYRHNWRRAE